MSNWPDSKYKYQITSKLSKAEVRKIRSERGSLSELAKRYNVSESTISQIKNRKTWRWVQ